MRKAAEGIAADYETSGILASIEILDATKRLGDSFVFKQVIMEDFKKLFHYKYQYAINSR